jgi:hypothetical protein
MKLFAGRTGDLVSPVSMETLIDNHLVAVRAAMIQTFERSSFSCQILFPHR